MNSPFPSNSEATCEPLMNGLLLSSVEMQSSFELLRRWREEDERASDDHDNSQKLAIDASAISIESEPSQSVDLSPETQEFLQVLRSWREEGDEEDDEEQRTTWKHLKQALDEDQLSDRKLFPEHKVASKQVQDINDKYQVFSEKGTDENDDLLPVNQAAIDLLRSWRESDDQERIDTWEYLKQALDEDRLSYRKLFP